MHFVILAMLLLPLPSNPKTVDTVLHCLKSPYPKKEYWMPCPFGCSSGYSAIYWQANNDGTWSATATYFCWEYDDKK